MVIKLQYICLLLVIFVDLCKSENSTGTNGADKSNNDDNDGENPTSSKDQQTSCSTSSISVQKKRFVYTWKIQNLMQTLEVYDTERFLEIQIGSITFNDDAIKGQWSFKLTNTKKYGSIAVYANHSYDDPKTISQKLMRISLKYSSQEYRGSPFYSRNTLKGTERTVNQIMNSNDNGKNSSSLCCCAPAPPVSPLMLPIFKKRNNKQDNNDEDSKYPNDYYTMRQQIPYSLFEFPIFDVFSLDNERSSKITEAEDLKLKFEIDVIYPEIVKEVSKSCVGI